MPKGLLLHGNRPSPDGYRERSGGENARGVLGEQQVAFPIEVHQPQPREGAEVVEEQRGGLGTAVGFRIADLPEQIQPLRRDRRI